MLTRLLTIDTALLSSRTVVRRFRENEGPMLFELFSDNHSWIVDHFPKTMKAISDKESAEFYIRRKIAAWMLQQEYCMGIFDTESAKLIGFIRIFGIDWHVPRGEMGFFIDQDFVQKGIMTEVMIKLLGFVFNQLEFEKLRIRTATDNYPTQRLVRKCGFRREGDLRDEFRRTGGELVDMMLFGLTKAEYEKV